MPRLASLHAPNQVFRGLVFDLFSRHTTNPWVEQDRQEQRRIILSVVVVVGVVAIGIGLLVYALAQ